MRLGKGNIKRNIKKQLDMSTLECEAFLAKFDNIYNSTCDILPNITKIKEVLNEYNNRAELSGNEIDKVVLKDKYLEIKSGTSIYWNNIPNIKHECEKKHIWETDIESQIEFFQKIEEMNRKSTWDSIEEINSTIFDKYLKKEFESIIHTNYEDVNKIPIELIEKFDEFYNIMDLFGFRGVEEFKKDYELLNKDIFIGACSKLKDETETNTLSTEKLENLLQLIRNDEDKEKFLYHVAKLTCPNNCEIAENLLNKLFAIGCLDLVNEYSAVRIKAGNTEMIGYQVEGNIAMLGSYSFISGIDTDNKLPDFDFTLRETEEEQAIINDFLKLKQQVMHENPDTTIKIEERLIVVENEDRQDYYLITDGKILPAQIEPIEDFKLNIVENEPQKEEQFPMVRKQGLFSRIGEAFKKYFSREEVIESEPYYFKPIESRQASFRSSMSDLSSYDTTQQNKIDTKEKQLTNGDKEIGL